MGPTRHLHGRHHAVLCDPHMSSTPSTSLSYAHDNKSSDVCVCMGRPVSACMGAYCKHLGRTACAHACMGAYCKHLGRTACAHACMGAYCKHLRRNAFAHACVRGML